MTCMDDEEKSLFNETLDFFSQTDTDTEAQLRFELKRIDQMADMANSFPSLLERGQTQRNRLVDSLCQVDSGMSAFSLPMRAVMGDAFLTAKIQLLQSLRNRLLASKSAPPPLLMERANGEVAQSIYTMLLSSLLWDLVRYRDLDKTLRNSASLELVYMWESPADLEIDDFFPMLEAAWIARNKIQVIYGTLIGTSEFFQLIRANCPDRFVSFFTRDGVGQAESQAFQEFLFGLPQEELSRLKVAMQDRGLPAINSTFAKGVLKDLQSTDQQTPEALFASYRRRFKAAKLRRLIDIPGPRHTAEGYMVLEVLANGAPHAQDFAHAPEMPPSTKTRL